MIWEAFVVFIIYSIAMFAFGAGYGRQTADDSVRKIRYENIQLKSRLQIELLKNTDEEIRCSEKRNTTSS